MQFGSGFVLGHGVRAVALLAVLSVVGCAVQESRTGVYGTSWWFGESSRDDDYTWPRRLVVYHADNDVAREALSTPGLLEVVFVNSALTDAAFEGLSQVNPSLTHIELLRLHQAPDMPLDLDDEWDDDAFPGGVSAATLKELARLPRLKHLNLTGVHVCAEGLDALFRNSSTLESLTLGGILVEDGDRPFRNVGMCRSLRSLRVHGCSKEDVADIARCRHLEHLALRSVETDAEALLALSQLTELRTLVLTTGIANDLLTLPDEEFSALLAANRNLEELVIFGASGSSGRWLEALQHTPRLRHLTIRLSAPFSLANAAPDFWANLQELERLDLPPQVDTPLDPAHAKAIAALPNLRSRYRPASE
jgi:hypothetical protein